jgi:hypothetical protein
MEISNPITKGVTPQWNIVLRWGGGQALEGRKIVLLGRVGAPVYV